MKISEKAKQIGYISTVRVGMGEGHNWQLGRSQAGVLPSVLPVTTTVPLHLLTCGKQELSPGDQQGQLLEKCFF